MTVSIIDSFKETNQAINTPEDVAKYIVGLEVATDMNGKAIYGTLTYTLSSMQNTLTLGSLSKVVGDGK